MIIHAPKLVPKGAAAITVFPFIICRDKENQKHLIEHEKVHLRQQVKYLFIGFALLYFGSKKWKYKFELEAYRVSVKHGLSKERAARHLSGPLYGCLVSYRQALTDLERIPYS